MSDARVTAMTITFIVAASFWITSIITIFYGTNHVHSFPHDNNPYYLIGGFGLIPSIFSTMLAIIVWADGLKEAR